MAVSPTALEITCPLGGYGADWEREGTHFRTSVKSNQIKSNLSILHHQNKHQDISKDLTTKEKYRINGGNDWKDIRLDFILASS